MRSAAASTPVRNKNFFLFWGGEAQHTRSEQGEISAVPGPGRTRAAAACALCLWLSRSSTMVLLRMNSPVQSLVVAVAAGKSPAWAAAGLMFFTPAERIRLSWKWHSQSGGLKDEEEMEGEWCVESWWAHAAKEKREEKVQMCSFCGSNKRSSTQLSQAAHKGNVNAYNHLQLMCELVEAPWHL